MEKRMKLTPEEQEIIQGMRHEKGIWNAALVEAMVEVHKFFASGPCDNSENIAEQVNQALIKLKR